MPDKSSQTDLAPVQIGRELSSAFSRLEERIRERAYQIFQGRGPGEGDSVADWMEAQLQLVNPVDVVIKDQKKNIVVEGDLKGFAPKEIEIEVGSADLKIFGSHTASKTSKKKGVTRSSSETMHFYQAVSLPCAVDIDTCQAKLFKNGKLRISLPKKQPSR